MQKTDSWERWKEDMESNPYKMQPNYKEQDMFDEQMTCFCHD